MPSSIDRYRGALLGQCLGDALGFPVEGHPPESCAAYVDGLRKHGPFLGRPPYAFGQYTDDSQLARELLSSFVIRQTFDPADYAQRVCALFAEGRIVGKGRATDAAAKRLAAGVPWNESGTKPPSAGNGSAMRAGPVGLMHPRDMARLRQVAADQGRITHQDPRCSAGAVTIAAAVAIALRDGALSPAAFCQELAFSVDSIDPILDYALVLLPCWVGWPPEAAVKEIAPLGKDEDAEDWPGISPFVTGSVIWSLYSFLRSPDDYLETIFTAIAVGGDVDTTAAMAGAISGARLGLTALPAWVRQLNDRAQWGHDDLVRLADDAHAVVSANRASEPAPVPTIDEAWHLDPALIRRILAATRDLVGYPGEKALEGKPSLLDHEGVRVTPQGVFRGDAADPTGVRMALAALRHGPLRDADLASTRELTCLVAEEAVLVCACLYDDLLIPGWRREAPAEAIVRRLVPVAPLIGDERLWNRTRLKTWQKENSRTGWPRDPIGTTEESRWFEERIHAVAAVASALYLIRSADSQSDYNREQADILQALESYRSSRTWEE